ncbi:MAG: IS5 family transposase [Burkholderia sp.]
MRGCLLSRQAANLGCLSNGTQGMEAPIIDDDWWTLIEPLLPPTKPRRKEHPGRPRLSDRAALNGILFVLKTGLRWNHLPTPIGLWLRRDLLATTARLAQSRSMGSTARTAARHVARGRADRSFIRCRRFLVGTNCWGGRKTGPNPTDRARPGSKRPILVDANGVPISAILTGANRNDVTQLPPLVDAIPPIRGARGRPLQRPTVIYAERGYDSDPHRQRLRERGIKPVLARRRTEHSSGLGKFRPD